MDRVITNDLGLLSGQTTLSSGLSQGEEILYTFQIGRQAGFQHSARITFDHLNGQGDLDLYLLEAGSTTPIAQSSTSTDRESIQFNNLAAGSYTLRVIGYQGVTGQNQSVAANSFTVSVAAPELTPIPDTAGSSFATAKVLDVATTRFNGSIDVANQTDYYRFSMSGLGLNSHYLNTQYDPSAGTVNLQLFDAAQQPIDLTNRLINVELPGDPTKFVGNTQISLAGLAAGDYFVTASSAKTLSYKLTLDVPQVTPDAWTVMTFITASNLDQAAPGNIEQMEVVLDQALNSVNLSVLWDQSSVQTLFFRDGKKDRDIVRYPTPGLAAWGDAGQATLRAGQASIKFYPQSKGKDPESNDPRIVSPFTRLGEKDTGDSESLTDFVQSSVTNAPAQNYALVMWDHGGATTGFNLDDLDVDAQGQRIKETRLTTSKLVKSLTDLKTTNSINLSLLAFDECLMASTEVAYELRTFTPVIVASQETISGSGYDYTQAFQALMEANPSGVTSAELAESIVTGFQAVYGPKGENQKKSNTLSAIDTGELPGLITAIQGFTTATNAATSQDWRLIARARSATRGFYDDSQRDLGFLMQNIQAETAISDQIRTAAGEVVAQLQQTVFDQTEASKRTTQGLLIFLPENTKAYQNQKDNYITNHSNFVDATQWDKFLDAFFKNTDTTDTKDSAFATATRPTVPGDPLDPSGPSFYNLQAGGLNVLTADAFFDAVDFEETEDPDIYPFAIGATGTFLNTIELYSSNPDATFTLNLSDDSNNSLRQISGKGNVILSLQDITAGSYVLNVLADQDVSNYSLYVKAPGFDSNRKTFVGNDQFQFNGSFLKAADVDENVFYTGNQLVAPTDAWYAQEDWYTLSLPRTVDRENEPFGTLAIYLAESNRRARVDLYDSNGNLRASNQGSGKLNITYEQYSNITYYFKVSRLEGDTAPLGYSFRFAPSENTLPRLSISNVTNDGQTTGLLEWGGNPEFAGLEIALTDKKVQPFNIDELGLIVVDDAEGTIEGLKPGQAGYVEAALERGRTIFSVLPDNFIERPTRVIDGFAETDRFLAFYLVKNGTRDQVLSNPALENQVLFGTASNGQDTGVVTSNALIGDRISVEFQDSSTSPSATLSVSQTDSLRPTGSDLQDGSQRELIDLRDLTGRTVELSFPVVDSEAFFNNTVGFYQIENEAGAVRDPLTGEIVNPGDITYAAAAIRNNQQLGITFGQSDAGISRDISGGFLYAPYIIANDSSTDEPDSSDPVYFVYLGANPDRTDHVRLLGNNTWGFEDLPNLGDADYNDIVFQANMSVK
ncbi:MAG: DUF4114 domain-containing protein [Aphanocapsa sp. GSE-SYN-MK-11-07L]|jgi:hypothetical protein|nr:DUF4114 domain-containing protein [Aphanocapsa sp. GSE-SYN-MK-11-07L]